MSDLIEMGFQPAPLRLFLNASSDFVCTLVNTTGDPWPAGTVLTLLAGSQAWTATITGTDAAFTVDKAEVANVGNGSVARLVYADPSGTDTLLAWGQVVRTDG